MQATLEATAGERPDRRAGAAARPGAAVGIAASAGGLAALTRVLETLPAELPAPVVVVQHVDPRHRSHLAEILGKRTTLPVRAVEDGAVTDAGTVYVAPPDRHTVFGPNGTLALDESPPVRFLRPSADVLFASLAEHYAEHAVAVVLTGSGNDGAAGVRAVKEHGGTVIAQDRATSEFHAMPAAAIESGSVDYVLPLDEIAPAIVRILAGGSHA